MISYAKRALTKEKKMENVCIVGYGAIGPIHAKALENIETARFYAVCDIAPERIEKCQKDYDVKAYADFDQMLLDPEIDCVHICTPHYLHFEMIKKALKSGKGVVCEKPITMTLAEYDSLLELDGADKVCVVLQNRYNPCAKKFKELAESEKMGQLKTARAVVTWDRDADYYNQDEWRGKWATEGGGVLINQAVHTLDYFSFFLGSVRSVKAQMSNFTLEDVIEVEDTMSASLVLKNGQKAVMFATNAYGVTKLPEFEAVFENGIIKYENATLYVDGNPVCTDKTINGEKSYWGIGHKALFKSYYEKGEYFSPHDIKDTMRTLFAMYESAKCGGCEVMIK